MRLYSSIRAILPERSKGLLSKFLILSGLKPRINKKVISPFTEGIVVFSADFEMAWAFRYSKTLARYAEEVGLKERENFSFLLKLFDHYNIPVTWATVGHLFLDHCSRNSHNVAHSELPRPDYYTNRNWLFESGDWYDDDPTSDVLSHPAWYAPDLIEQITTSRTLHEIGCHTFSHLDFTYTNCRKELANAELQRCKELAEQKGIKLRSFVFPGGTFGNYESIKENGFICYRKPVKHHLDLPYPDKNGLLVIPSSLCLDKDTYGWSKEFHLKIARKFLAKASKHKLVCHFWFHPSMDKWYLENVMPEIIKMVIELRESKKIRILTMGSLSDEYLKDIKIPV